MNNELFSTKRLALVLRKNWVEAWKPNYYARLWTPFLAIAVTTWTSFISRCNRIMDILPAGEAYIGGNWDGTFSDMSMQVGMIWFVFLFFSATFVSSQLSRPRQRVRWLTTPASTLEKYLGALIPAVLFMVILIPLSFFVSEVLRVGVCSVLYPRLDIPWMDYSQLLVGSTSYQMFGDCQSFRIALSLLLLLFSLFAFGSTLWPKGAFLKTVAGLALVGAVFGWVGHMGVQLLFADGWAGFSTAFYLWGKDWSEPVSPGAAEAIFHCLTGAGSLFFLVMGYYRLKEMEIINRW